MSEITEYRPAALAVVPNVGTDVRTMRLVEWAQEADAAYALAEKLCQTPFAGQYRDDRIGATAAILKGAEVGLTPVTSLGAFDLIQGAVAPKAITLRALAQSHGHNVWIESANDTAAICKGRRRGQSEVHSSTWTIARAAKLGLTNKANWKNQPQAMLIARATAEVCRMVAADVILGIGYSAEEMADEGPIPTTTVQRAPTAKRTAQRAVAPEPEEPSLEPEPEVEPAPTDPDPVDDDGMITKAQQGKMGALMKERGITERAAALAFVGEKIGRPVITRNELTKAEASRVIDALEGFEPEPEVDGDPDAN